MALRSRQSQTEDNPKLAASVGTVSQLCIVRLLFVLAPALNFICSVMLSVGTFTEDWEYLDFDMEVIKDSLEPTGIVSVPHNVSSYFTINLERLDGTSTGLANVTIVPARRKGGLWKICNVLPDEVFAEYQDVPRCLNYLRIYHTQEDGYYRSEYRIMMQLTRSAETCAIVALLVVGLGLITGFISVLLHQCVCSMVTGMCLMAGGFYTIFTSSLMVIRTNQLLGSLVTADTFDGDISAILATKTISSGWSMTVTWLTAVLCLISSAAWFLLLSILRKDTSRDIIRYKQFCGE